MPCAPVDDDIRLTLSKMSRIVVRRWYHRITSHEIPRDYNEQVRKELEAANKSDEFRSEDKGSDQGLSADEAPDCKGHEPAPAGDNPPGPLYGPPQAERAGDIQEDGHSRPAARRPDQQGLLERARRGEEDGEDCHTVQDRARTDNHEAPDRHRHR